MDHPRTPLRRPLALALLLVFGAAAPLAAQITLDFEGLRPNAAIPNTYGGFTSWGGLHAVPSVYGCSATDSTCATNAFALTAGFQRVERFRPLNPFGLISAYFTSWAVRGPTTTFNTPFEVFVRGYAASGVVYSQTITVPSARTRIWFVWPNLTSVVFQPTVDAWFLMDDVTYVNGSSIPPEAVVPEPVTLLLLGSGLAGLGGVGLLRRRRGPANLSD